MNTGDGGKVGIWGGISDFGATNAKVCTANMNRRLCCDVLQNEIKRFLAKIPTQGKIVFQPNLAPWYTSNIVKEKIVKPKLGLFDWAPKMPDLNPVEMLWFAHDKKLITKPFYSKAALTDRPQEE